MMEAKDTVMGDEGWEAINKKAGVDVIDIVVNLDNRYTPIQQAELIVERCRLTAQTQAEISFKAGEEQGLLDKIGVLNAEYRAGKKAGIKEAVEWIDEDFMDAIEAILNDYCQHIEDDGDYGKGSEAHTEVLCQMRQVYRAQLKEWGIVL